MNYNYLIILFLVVAYYFKTFNKVNKIKETLEDKSKVVNILIEDFKYLPQIINVKVGTTIKWTNFDIAPHTVTHVPNGDGILFDSGIMNQNDIFELKFDKKGSFKYYCTLHPYMRAKVNVV